MNRISKASPLLPGTQRTRLLGAASSAPTPTVLTDGIGTRLRRDFSYQLLTLRWIPSTRTIL
jgi:hypothetical protein